MLEELFNLVKGVASQNQNLPSTQKDDIAAEATNTVASGMRNMVAGGGLESLISMFSNSNDQQKGGNSLMSNPIVSMMVGHFAEKLMSKYNLNSHEASNVASSMIPDVISNLVKKSNDGNSGFSLENLLNSITGGKVAEVAPQQGNSGGGLQDILSQLSGGNSNSGGGGLMDIIGQLAGGAQQQQQRNGGGGLMDLIKGFIK